MISVVLLKGSATFITYVRGLCVREPGSEHQMPCHKSGTEHRSTSLYDYSTNCSWLWLHGIRPAYKPYMCAYSNDLTPSNYYQFQNLKSYLCAVRCAWQCMTQGCLRWCCESLPYLTVYDDQRRSQEFDLGGYKLHDIEFVLGQGDKTTT